MQVWSLDQEDPLEEGSGNPLQYSCLETHGQGAWQATVHGAVESDSTEATYHIGTHVINES